MFLLTLFFLIGSALVVTPFVPNLIPGMTLGLRIMMVTVGCGILVVVGIVTMISKLYRRTSANMAFVRTGMRGVQVIKDRGAIVIPVVHHITPVSLETMR